MKVNPLLNLFKRHNGNNLLFLDYDGVFLCLHQEVKPYVERIERLCREFELKVVISSSWREYYPQCLDVLREAGFTQEVIGRTSLEGYDRNKQIFDYIKKHGFHKLLILDDMPLWFFCGYHVQTDFERGFDDEAYALARRILLKQK